MKHIKNAEKQPFEERVIIFILQNTEAYFLNSNWIFPRECPGIFFFNLNIPHAVAGGRSISFWHCTFRSPLIWSNHLWLLRGIPVIKLICINFSHHVAPCFGSFSGQLSHWVDFWTPFCETPGVKTQLKTTGTCQRWHTEWQRYTSEDSLKLFEIAVGTFNFLIFIFKFVSFFFLFPFRNHAG